MIAEDKPGWFTYRIRKKRPLGVRYAAYRFTRGLPGLILSAGRKLASLVRNGIANAARRRSGLGRRKGEARAGSP